jgi:ring-1,2-phenylacetyl-CoA epoxidase subunit PaaE
MSHAFHELTVAEITPLTADAAALTFDVPEALRDAFAFRPGQHLILRARVNGEDMRRSYSICAAPGQKPRIGVKRIEDGRFSGFLTREVKPGDRIEVMPPEGRFGVEIGGRHDYLLIAAGSGVTPILSILRSVLEGEPESTATLVYGNREAASIMFHEELEDLKDRFLERFTLVNILSREEQDAPLLSGRIDAERIGALARAGLIEPARADGVFLCGPGGMIDAAAEALKALGTAPERIRFELFTPAEDAPPPKPVSEAARRAAARGVAVEAIVDGVRKRFSVSEPGRTVLEAAEAAGHELPFSCRGGMCCTCRCRIVEGEGEMAANWSLEKWEVEAGYTLACQTRPLSDRLVLDFDAV